VLHIQLKRFQYKNGRIVKLSNPLPFPNTLDLSPYCVSSSPNGHNKSSTYQLHAVLIHTGSSSQSGHYYTYIDTKLGNRESGKSNSDKRKQISNEDSSPVEDNTINDDDNIMGEGRWTKFDDTSVTPVSWSQVLAEGSSSSQTKQKSIFGFGGYSSSTSAYLLQYVRSDIVKEMNN
jgi:hypothetical protein